LEGQVEALKMQKVAMQRKVEGLGKSNNAYEEEIVRM